MNKKTIRITVLILCAVLCLSGVLTALALTEENTEQPQMGIAAAPVLDDPQEQVKDETVYVLAGADGSVRKIIVSDWLKNVIGASSVSDFTDLTNVENVKSDESYASDGNAMIWDAQGNDVYYQGTIDRELPVGLSVTYQLDGKPVSADEIAGKSGNVAIRFDYENRQRETVVIDGKDETICVPFAVLTGMLLDNDVFRNVEVTNGKLINDGDRTVVVGIAMPGMQETLGIARDTIQIPDYVEITADAVDFQLGMTVTLVTNELFNRLAPLKFDSADGLTGSIGELTDGMNQLLDGSSLLYDGLSELLEKSEELTEGIGQLAEGGKALQEGVVSLADGAGQLNNGAAELSDGLNTLRSNNDALNGGAKQVFETLLSTAEAQIKAGGVSVPALTIQNYSEVLSGVIRSLDKTAVSDQALAQVTAAVEENRPLILAKVTAAVREQVAEQIIGSAVQMSRSDYEAAAAAGMIPQESQTAINAAIEAQMQTDPVKKAIFDNVEAQIAQAISENMASDAVQSKLAAAAEGAKSITALKNSLDSFNTFYLGLLTYTGGVASAADGAAVLADGTSGLKDGAVQLKDGSSALSAGLQQLQDGTPALADGVSQLKDGAMQLRDGLNVLYQEGIQKIVELVDGDLSGIVERLKATIDVSKQYRNFAGIGDGMDGQVKFIYRTDEIRGK